MTNRSANVLLVEDDFVLASSTMELLQALGYNPSLAGSATAAFQRLSEPHELDVVLLDLQLGRELGEVLVQRLRQSNVALPPIIILSAQPMSTLQQAARVTEAKAILQKPCSGQRLFETIGHVLA